MPHFVKKFDINGVKTKQVACIELHGRPNAATKGAVGVLGMDVDSPTHEIYKCVGVMGGIYAWEVFSGDSGGSVGITPVFEIDEVVTLEAGERAYVDIDNTDPTKPRISFGIPQGADGIGKDGAHVISIDEMGRDATKTTYKMRFSDGTGYDFDVYHGKGGADGKSAYEIYLANGGDLSEPDWLASLHGKDGQDGAKGADGKDGVNGADGKDGANGKDGTNGQDGTDGVGIESVVQTTTSTADGGENVITVTLTNGNKSAFKIKNGSKGSEGDTGATGANGKDGTNGKDGANGVGIKSITKTSTSGLVDTYTITLTNNTTTTFTVTNGKDGTNGETASIPAHWESPVNECIAKIKALQDGRNCVTFPFFSDNHTRDGNPQYMGMLIARVMEECGIPYCFCGGDAITSAIASNKDSEGNFIDTDTDFRNQAQAFKDAMSYIPDGRFCMALGNHETYLAKNPNISGSTRAEYSRAQTYDIFLREQGSWQNKHFGGDGTYYFVDDLPSKVRFIVLNTNGIGDTNIDPEQLDWFENTALKFNESGWGVVIISHIPITNHYAQSNIGNNIAVISMLQDYMGGEDENKADIIGWFSGHIHRDRIYEGVSVNDTDSSESESKMGFKQVTITSDHTVIAYKNDDGTTSPTYHPVGAHGCGNACVKNHAIDFVTINKDTKTVNITRLGIGSDRSYTYGEYEEPTTTNFADPSNTSEWLHDTRLSSSNTTACTGMTTTNYIDTEEGDIVTVSGINLDANLGGAAVGAVSVYVQTNKNTCNSRAATRSAVIFVSEANGVYTFKGVAGYLRFCGVLTNGDENAVINIQRNGVWL